MGIAGYVGGVEAEAKTFLCMINVIVFVTYRGGSSEDGRLQQSLLFPATPINPIQITTTRPTKILE